MEYNKDYYETFWKEIGKTDPYFGVITNDKFLSENIDEANKAEFFLSGQHEINSIFQAFNRYWPDQRISPQRALDFGCGTGRLVLALAEKCKHVTGVDISESMLKEARNNAIDSNRTNTEFLLSQGTVPFLHTTYDYINSSLVFQHIHPEKGMEILRHLLAHLEPKGFFFLQITYFTDETSEQKAHRYRLFSDPTYMREHEEKPSYRFPMFDYDLNQLMPLFQANGINKIYSSLGTSGAHHFIQLHMRKG